MGQFIEANVGSNLLIKNCTVKNNNKDVIQSEIFNAEGFINGFKFENITIDSNLFENNIGLVSSTGYFVECNNLIVKNSVFDSNNYYISTGGLTIAKSENITIINNVF